MRPVSNFAYEIFLLRVSDLLRTYTTYALKATCAYEYNFARKRLIAYVYDFCAETTYVYEVRILRISNLLCTCKSSTLEATYAYEVRLYA